MMATSGNGSTGDELSTDDVGTINIGPGTIDPSEFRPSTPMAAEPDLYVAVLVIESTSDAENYQPLYEESFVLLKAVSEEEAHDKATEYGKQHEAAYRDEHDQLITWTLKRVVEVRPVEDATFDDGTELYSRFFRNYAAYAAFEPLNSDEP